MAPDFSDEVLDMLAVAILGLLVATLAISSSFMSTISISSGAVLQDVVMLGHHVLYVLEARLVVHNHTRASTVRAARTA